MIRLFTRRRAAPPRQGPGPVATADRVGSPRDYLHVILDAAGVPSSPSQPSLTAQRDDSGPDFIETTSVLTAVVRPGLAPLEPGRYRVTYSRLGSHGRAGTPPPVPLTTSVADDDDLAEAITQDAGQYLDGARPDVVIDLAVMGGHIRAGGRTVGAFTLRLTEPDQEENRVQDH